MVDVVCLYEVEESLFLLRPAFFVNRDEIDFGLVPLVAVGSFHQFGVFGDLLGNHLELTADKTFHFFGDAHFCFCE